MDSVRPHVEHTEPHPSLFPSIPVFPYGKPPRVSRRIHCLGLLDIRRGYMAQVRDLPLLDLTLRVAIAAVAAGLLGLERELRGHPAGIRTHTLVAVGAALFTVA